MAVTARTPGKRTWQWFAAATAVVAVLAGGTAAGIMLGRGGGGAPSPAAGTSPKTTPSASATSPKTTPSASATSPALKPLVAVMSGGALRLLDLGGSDVTSATPTNSNGALQFVGTGGSRAIYLERTEIPSATGGYSYDWTLKALHRDGSIETLQRLGLESFQPGGRHLGYVVASPNGRNWLWTEWVYSDAGNVYHSTLHLVDAAGTDRIVASLDSNDSHIVIAYRWDAAGAIVVHTLIGIGSSSPLGLGALGDAYLLDAATGTLSPLWQGYGTPGACNLHARSSGGTIACVAYDGSGGWILRIGVPPNLSISIPLNRARFAGAGSISFQPGDGKSLLAIGGWSDTRRCATDLVNATTGDISRFGPDGLCPPDGSWGWLEDGSLIESKIPSPDDPSQIAFAYVVSPSGSARQLAQGLPVGVLYG